MRGAIQLGIGTVITILLAVLFLIAIFFIYYGGLLPFPFLIENLTHNNSVVLP